MSMSSDLPRGARIALRACCAALLILAAVPSFAAERELVVSAAASLTNAFDEIKGIFEKRHPGLVIRANYAASTPLLKQMLEGAPADVFASADQATMNKAVEGKVVDPATRKDFVRNTLVLIVPKGAKKPAKLEDIRQMKRIAVGSPAGVPAGRYTQEALTGAGLWDAIQPQVVNGGSVRQVLDYVARGEVDAGFVYGTDAARQADKVDVVMTMSGHKPVLYPVAVATTGKNPTDAKAFVDFVTSDEGMAILAKHGFAKP